MADHFNDHFNVFDRSSSHCFLGARHLFARDANHPISRWCLTRPVLRGLMIKNQRTFLIDKLRNYRPQTGGHINGRNQIADVCYLV